MPHGMPDWGLVGPKNITYGLDDLGEAVVRLGSPHLWDRRGDALYLTDFSDGLGMFQTGGSGALFAVDLVTSHARQGAYSVRLRAGSTVNMNAYLAMALPFQMPSGVGLEFSFSIDQWTQYVLNYIHWWDGTKWYWAGVLYDFVAKTLSYGNFITGFLPLAAGIDLHECTYPEHTMKMVVRMDMGKYERFMLDALSYDMETITIDQGAAVVAPYWYFSIYHYAVPGHNPDCYIDNVIVTQNEP